MKVVVIDASEEPMQDPPLEFINGVITGKGGFIKIEPGAPPPKVLWTLKSLLLSMSLGFQWATIQKLMGQGMHGEHAEHHVTKMLNELVSFELACMPSQDEIDGIEKKIKDGDIDSD
jgi:hypothetical protein